MADPAKGSVSQLILIQNLAPRTRSLTSATPDSVPSVAASSSLSSLPLLSKTPQSKTPVDNPSTPDSDNESSPDAPHESDTLSSDDDSIMSNRLSTNGRIDYGNGKSNGPLVKQKALFDIFDYTDLRDSIEDYAKQNKITAPSDVRELWRKAWRDFKEDRMWFRMHKDRHDQLSNFEFDTLLHSHFLGALWPSDVALLRSRSHMKPTGSGAFADYAGEVQTLNCELEGTNYFYDNKQLLALLSDGLIKAFREDLVYEKLEMTPTTDLDVWVTSVIDFETRSKWRHPKPTSSNNNAPLSNSSSYNSASSSSNNSRYPARPNTGPISVEEINALVQRSKSGKAPHYAGRLSESDKRLLDLIEACYHCRTGWAGHRSTDPACPGIRLEVPYRPPTRQMMNKAIEIHKAKGCAITYNALLKAFPETPVVSSVSSHASLPVLDDLSAVDSLPPVHSYSHTHTPVTAAVNPYGSYPVSAVIPDSTLYHERSLRSYSEHCSSLSSSSVSSSSTSAKPPLAAVVPRRGRWSDFVETDILVSDSEDEQSSSPAATPVASVSVLHQRSLTDSAPPEKRRRSDEHGASIPVFSESVTSVSAPVASVSTTPNTSVEKVDDVAANRVSSDMPFFKPHLIWRARVLGSSESNSREADMLIDNGCPFVLIDTNMVSSLGLKSRRLHIPRAMTLAMSDGQPQVFTATHYCKVSLRDPMDWWRSRTVRALILPSLSPGAKSVSPEFKCFRVTVKLT
ncbi:hypothetical protein C8R42DRAFT_721681 [Lentinula raphanica]|nr:hypothetical protein C8R42DRAFT_721681 [Lentinula raphanica]